MTRLTIKGMHCKSCVTLIQDILQDIPGVKKADVNMGSAEVEHDPTVKKETLVRAIQGEGYQAEAR